MNHDLIQRYIYAVTRRLPGKMRADIEKELHALIADMLEERCGDMPPAEHDIRVILTEIGTPDELAQKYDPDAYSALIAGPYYRKYKFVLKIVLAATGGGLLLANFLTALLGAANGEFLLFRLFSWLGTLLMGLLFAFAFVTALFALFERRGVKLDSDNSLSDLPPVPVKQHRIERREGIIGILLCTVFLAVMLWGAPYLIGAYTASGFVPLFHQPVVQRHWPVLLGICALGVLKEVFKLIEGRYTLRLAIATLVLNLGSLALTLLFFNAPGLVDPAFIATIQTLFGEGEEFIVRIFTQFPLFFLCVAAFATLLDSVMSFVRIDKAAKD